MSENIGNETIFGGGPLVFGAELVYSYIYCRPGHAWAPTTKRPLLRNPENINQYFAEIEAALMG
jgi:hypothetical protein